MAGHVCGHGTKHRSRQFSPKSLLWLCFSFTLISCLTRVNANPWQAQEAYSRRVLPIDGEQHASNSTQQFNTCLIDFAQPAILADKRAYRASNATGLCSSPCDFPQLHGPILATNFMTELDTRVMFVSMVVVYVISFELAFFLACATHTTKPRRPKKRTMQSIHHHKATKQKGKWLLHARRCGAARH